MKKIYSLKYNKTKLIETLSIIRDTITSTMGPAGSTNILYNGIGVPHVTKDGVSVAEFLEFDDPFMEAINKIVKETARSTGHKVGDGTTTSILLATELIIKLLELDTPVSNLKSELKKIAKSIEVVVDNIDHMKQNVETYSDNTTKLNIIKAIIKMSSDNDTVVIDTIMDVIEKIGPNGLIDVTLSNGETTYVDIMDGMLIEAPAYVTQTKDVDKPYIVLVANSIDKVHEIKSFMILANSLYAVENAEFIIIAKEFSQEVQNIVSINNRNNKFKVYLAESDGFGFNELEILDDMASLLKCKVLSTDHTSQFGLQNVKQEYLARVKSATISPQYTVLYNDDILDDEALAVKTGLETKIAAIKSRGNDKVGELRQLERRLSKFSKSAIIRVGGTTEVEKVELKDRMDDAVQAVHAAVNNGVVPGGGYALYMASKSLNDKDIVKYLCMVPAEILSASTYYKRDTIFEKYFDKGIVIDFATETPADPYEAGILDPADVAIKALQQAFAVAKSIVGSHSIIINIIDDEV
jgi:chaperonin GroEL